MADYIPKLLILDVDGVLTDGTKYYGIDGCTPYKRFHDLDFTAIKCFQSKGCKVCWLSADANVNEKVAEDRGIDFHNSRNADGTINKVEWLSKLLLLYGIDDDAVAYVGDDLFDIPIMKAVQLMGGTAYCPNTAAPQVQEIVTEILPRRGGDGVVMELFYGFCKDHTAPCT